MRAFDHCRVDFIFLSRPGHFVHPLSLFSLSAFRVLLVRVTTAVAVLMVTAGVQRADHGLAQQFCEAPEDQRGPRQGRRGRRRACRDGGSEGATHNLNLTRAGRIE